MTQPEARLSRKIQTDLRAAGYFCFKVHGSEMMMAGLPDIIVCAHGLFIGLETKMPGEENDVSVRQQRVHHLIKLAGGTATVVTSTGEALEAVQKTLENFVNSW